VRIEAMIEKALNKFRVTGNGNVVVLPLEHSHIYGVIHKSLRDLKPLLYRSRDGHAKGEHVNRGRDILIFCPTLQMLDMSTLVTRQMSIL
jgi:hypothetical protein